MFSVTLQRRGVKCLLGVLANDNDGPRGIRIADDNEEQKWKMFP